MDFVRRCRMQENLMQRQKDLLRAVRRWERRGWGMALLGALVLMLTASGGASPTPGALTQLAGTDGCVSETGSGGDCVDGKALDGANSVAVSPDGKHLYVASAFSDAVAIFARNKTTGALTQLAGTDGCVKEVGDGVECADGKGLDGAVGVAVSKDGKHVYVASSFSDAVAVFSREK